ncbi:MarR family transcriptional regulator [Aerococcus sanguinicola]|uniref:MarR family transcriptional regulator n=1 Tax=Aerococcus sanguinicola TaxID=119206 RepID=A0A2I1MLW6_9LACT|nr:MarR family transcriptional regulator [Aerococcus sanguinicola]
MNIISKGDGQVTEDALTISHLIFQLANLQKKYLFERLKEVDLNPIQAQTLHYIYREAGPIQRSLATYLGKHEATISNILNVLEDRGYLYRQTASDNSRQKQIFLTASGHKQVEKINGIFKDLEAELCSDLSKEDRAKVLQVLTDQRDQFVKNRKKGDHPCLNS